jgi:hypothetical protein
MWDVMSHSSLKVYRRFGEGWRVSEARNQHEAGSKNSIAYSSTLNMEAIVSSDIISKKTELFIITVVRTINPKKRDVSTNFSKTLPCQVSWIFAFSQKWAYHYVSANMFSSSSPCLPYHFCVWNWNARYIENGSRDSSVAIAMGCGMGGHGIEIRFHVGERIFSSP